jgi:glycosyltransferase involved in cell wall biosynthesis
LAEAFGEAMRKILFVSNRTSFSGGEVVLLRLIEHNRHITPVVVTPKSHLATILRDDNVTTHLLAEIGQLDRKRHWFWIMWALRNVLLSQRRLVKIIKEENPDVVHANALGAAIYSFLPSFFARKPFVWTSHNIYSKASLNAIAARLVGMLSTRIVSVSKAVQRNLLTLGVPSGKIVTIYNGLELPPPSQKTSNFLHSKFHLSASTKVVALIAAITPWKGQELLLNAAAQLIGEYPRTAFFLIGTIEDPEYADKLKQKISNLNLAGHVFITGFLPNVTDLYPDIDILVNASIEPEPFGTTIYEAMAAGCIAIASSIGGSPEIIDNGKTGFLFKEGDSHELATKISFVLSHSGKLDNIGKDARHSVAEHFNINNMVEKYNNLYENL